MQKGKLLALVMALVLMLAMATSAGAVSKSDLTVSLPSNYEDNVFYPVIYMLPHDGVSSYIDIVDELHSSMDLIVVQPKKLPSTDLHTYLNDVVALVDSEYSTIKDAKYRALVGSGVGGYLAYAVGMTDNTGKFAAPSTFSFIGSINGNFVNNTFCTTYGSVFDMLNKAGATKLSDYFTYLDTPVDSQWCNDEGSSNDIGQLMIEQNLPSTSRENTTRIGTFDSAFQTESGKRIADRFSKWVLDGIFAGEISLENNVVAANANAKAIADITVSDKLSKLFGGNAKATVIVTLADPKTGKTVSESTSVTVKAGDALNKNLSVKNISTGVSASVTLSVKLLNMTLDLDRLDLVCAQAPIYNGDYQAISLNSDWSFNYVGKQKQSGIKLSTYGSADYQATQSWELVQPGLDWWKIGFGNISLDNVSVPSWAGFLGLTANDCILGDAYYVKTFTLDKAIKNPILSIGYVDDRCEVWLNGVRVGGTGTTADGNSTGETSWAFYSAFEIDPALLNVGGENVVVVRSMNDYYGGGGWYAGPIGLYSEKAFDDYNPEKYNPHFYEDTFYSEALGRDNEYLIYLPKDYYESDRFYPTMYLMHQYNSDHTSYKTDKINELMDEAAEKGLFDEMIVVAPNSAEESWWKNEWEEMVVTDLVAHIEKNFRAIPDARYRLTAGCSMGGQGAYNIALRNPNVFSGAVSFFGGFSYGGSSGSGINPNVVAKNESAEYMDYFSLAFICGNQDMYKFGSPAIDLSQQLEKMGVDHYFLIENGNHDSAFYRPRFHDTVGYVRNNMYKTPSVSAASLIKVDFSATDDILTVNFTADEAIKKFFNVIPASTYTKDTNPGVTIPVIATIDYEVKPGALAFLYATALAAQESIDVKFNVTFNDDELTVSKEINLADVLPKNAKIQNVTFETQLLGRDAVSDKNKVEELKVIEVDLPATGDNSNIIFFAALLMVSVVSMVIVSKKKASC